MNENDWTQSIKEKLEPFLKKHSLYVDTLRKLPYLQEIIGFSEENANKWKPDYMDPARFETDMLIYEITDDRIIPRVIIEAKIDHVTTHDSITYSYKAEKHKSIMPFIRYGIMIGDRGDYPLPGLLFRHGTNFDFMFSFTGTSPSNKEWKSFKEMLLKEVDYSRLMEEMLHESRNKNRKHYYMLQKQLVLKEHGE